MDLPVPQPFRTSQSRPPARIVKPKKQRHERYDGKWKSYSERRRKQQPFCVHCRENDRFTLVVMNNTGVVDHKWPVELGGEMWDPRNHWELCNACHNGWKRRLEMYAEQHDQIHMLPVWCDNPESRPAMPGDIKERSHG